MKGLHPLPAETPGPGDSIPPVHWIAFCGSSGPSNIRVVITPARAFLDMAIPSVGCRFRERLELHVDRLGSGALRVVKNVVGDSAQMERALPHVAVGIRTFPNDGIDERLGAE
jgi:hypothetical protein